MNVAHEAAREFMYRAGGTLPADAPSYVTRRADEALLRGLEAGEFCYILTARQMGKSSLMVRAAYRLREAGHTVAVIDLTALGVNLTVEQWYDGLLGQLARQIGLEEELEEYWLQNDRLSPLQRWMGALRDVVLPRMTEDQFRNPKSEIRNPKSLVIFVDEIDVTRSLPFSADEFFTAVRECYNRRATDPLYELITFCLVGVAAPSDLIRVAEMSPFNIGRRIELSDFTPEEAAPLAKGLRVESRESSVEGVDPNPRLSTLDSQLLFSILHWTNGHPYLTQRLCKAVAESAGDAAERADPERLVNRVCRDVFLHPGAEKADDNLTNVSHAVRCGPVPVSDILLLFRRVRYGRYVANDETNPVVSQLHLSGVVRAESGRLRVRNRIYETVFDKAWIDANMPDAELRRQREAYRRGLVRASAAAAAVIGIMTWLAVTALTGKRDAVRNAAEARHNLYIANMGLLRKEWDAGNLMRMRAILAETSVPGYDRGFEWGYWHRLAYPNVPTIRPGYDKVLHAVFSPDGKRIATAGTGGLAHIWDSETRKLQVTLAGHGDSVNTIVFSPDGARVITGSGHQVGTPKETTARIWDAATGACLQILRGHRFSVISASFSMDGKTVVTGSMDGEISFWDAATGRRVSSIMADNSGMSCCAMSPDGRTVAAPTGLGKMTLWDTRTGRPRLAFEVMRDVAWLVYSRDGKRLAAGGFQGQLGVWNTRDGKPVAAYPRQATGVSAVAFSKSGKWLLVGCAASSAKMIHVESGREQFAFLGHASDQGAAYVTSIDFAPDDSRFITSSEDGTVKVWDWSTASGSSAFSAWRTPNLSIALSPDGSRFAVGGGMAHVRLYHTTSAIAAEKTAPKREELFAGWGYAVTALTVSRNGRYLLAALAGRHEPTHWDFRTGFTQVLYGHDEGVTSADFSPDSTRIVTGSADNAVKVWDSENRRLLLIAGALQDDVASVEFSPDGKRVLAGGRDGSIIIWDARSGRKLLSLRDPNRPVHCLAYSPDGRSILRVWGRSGGASGMDILSAKTGSAVGPRIGPVAGLRSAALSPDGAAVALGSEDGRIVIWNARSGRATATVTDEYDGSSALRLLPDGKRIAGVDRTAAGAIWDIRTGKQLVAVRDECGYVKSVTLSHDGSVLFTGSESGLVSMWNSSTGERLKSVGRDIKSFQTVCPPVRFLAYSPDGSRLAVSAGGIYASLHDAKTGAHLARYPTDPAEASGDVAFSPDGKTLAASDSGGTVTLFDSASGRVIRRLRAARSKDVPLAYFPDGRTLAAGYEDGSVILWDASTGKRLMSSREHRTQVSCVAVSRDGRLLATGATEPDAKLWDARSLTPILTLKGHAIRIRTVHFSPDAKRLLTCGADNSARLWELATGKEALTLDDHPDILLKVDISRDGKRIIGGYQEGSVRFWAADSWNGASGRAP